jgi:hypothetical protein
MNTTNTFKFRTSLQALLGIAALVAMSATAGCDEGHQGDRCVAALSHNDCASSDLTCMQPTDCPETYCCPSAGTAITSTFCQPGCSGGALSILFATCSTASPSPLCPCMNIIGGLLIGPLSPDAYPPGVNCSCASNPDPIACLAATASTPDAGSATPDAGSSAPDAADASGE